MLWKRSIQAIGGNWLFGIGTGTLPSDFMMFDASFHNQFLQLFMQNGALGLLTFYYLLYTLWKPMANNLRDPVIKICAAGFFGIIIYNSFETTLLQNKIALGLIEWQLIAIGVSRGERINGISRDKNIYRKGGKKCTRY
jgi:O-antigen ligase